MILEHLAKYNTQNTQLKPPCGLLRLSGGSGIFRKLEGVEMVERGHGQIKNDKKYMLIM